MDFPAEYNPKEEEPKLIQFWKDSNTYTFKQEKGKEIFSIDTPPPTVSGKMHIGHAFSYSQQDFAARFQRMSGKNVFYPFGTDDNGLPTERLVEKLKKVQSTRMDRKEFRDLCYSTILEIKADFIADWIRIGMSCDFSKTYSTISQDVQKISQASFIDLHKKGLIYQQEAPMSWCTKCQTAIAQAEFESKDITSSFNDITFTSSEGDKLIIATTRPEFLPACVALFAHPDDKRYSHLKDKTAKVPIFNHDVPILFDQNVAMDKGTGLMMVCTFGDKEDIDKWNRYQLPLKIIFTTYGKMNELAGTYKGLSIVDARKAIIQDLKTQNFLVSQKDIVHAVNVHERCGTELEFLKTKQWFIKVLDKKEELLKQAEKIQWYPEFMKKRMINWIENLNWDWCISRQRHFGIPFPVWYEKSTGKILLPEQSQLPIDPLKDLPKGYTKDQVAAETDVMDTWATSALTPEISLASYGLDKALIPMNLRPQAHDIIRTWAFYTIVRNYYDHKKIPWKDITISGFVTLEGGEKMSKSKGNVIAPQAILDKHSADILRFWAAGAKLGEDLAYQEKDIQTARKTVIKLWNAAKFANLLLKDYNGEQPKQLEAFDRWLLTKLNALIISTTESFNKYEYAKVKQETEQFFWHIFCDNYLELIKDRLYNPDKRGKHAKISAQYTLSTALLTLIKLFAPIMPFITETIYRYQYQDNQQVSSIHLSKWPQELSMNDQAAEAAGDQLIQILAAVRQAKNKAQKSLKEPVKQLIIESELDLEEFKEDVASTTQAAAVEFAKADTVVAEKLKVTIEL